MEAVGALLFAGHRRQDLRCADLDIPVSVARPPVETHRRAEAGGPPSPRRGRDTQGTGGEQQCRAGGDFPAHGVTGLMLRKLRHRVER